MESETSQRKKYLFVLCPPFNGSTVLYKIINSSRATSTFLGRTFNNKGNYVIPKGEGHTLLLKNIPIYSQHRHDPNFKLPMKLLKERYDEHWNLDKPILCDKSPPFVHFAHQIESYFEQFGDVYFICMIRSPYSSRWIKSAPWTLFAKEQRHNIETLKRVIYFRYEDLVSKPHKVKQQIVSFLPELHDIDMKAHEVPGLKPNEERNRELNTETRDRIEHQEEKNRYLKDIPEELDFFGYPFVHIG